MKIRTLLLFAALVATFACTKDKEIQLCNPQTLLVKFTCGADLLGTDALDFHVVRDDGVDVPFSTTLSCPGTRSFQVNVPDYVVGRIFRITATPMKASVANGAPNALSGVGLAANCTSIEFPLTVTGTMPMPVVDGGNGDLDAEAMIDTMTDVASCAAGSLGCLCNDGTCGSGLVCRDSTCISPTCGNGKVDPGEDCDQGPLNTNDVDLCSLNCVSCSNRQGFLACGESCLAGAECCPGTACGPAAVCSANSLTARSGCGSDGKCPAAKAAPCDSFLVCADGISCRSSCLIDAECIGGRRCQNGTCITPSCGNGKQEAGEQCDDGNTNDLDACSNACVTCANRSGFLACGSSCIQGATCCPGALCGAASCVGSTFTPAQMCGAGGQCPVGNPASCGGNFVCEGGACKTSCASSGQCANGRVCLNGDCITPVCGNGVLEPTEQCDNGANNGDAKSCSSKCENCGSRVGMKDCGGGVCVAAGGLNCCADVDCPLANTAGKCDGATHTCWVRETIDLKPDPTKTGWYYRDPLSDSTVCFQTDKINLHPKAGFLGIISFASRIPVGAVIESAILSAFQYGGTNPYFPVGVNRCDYFACSDMIPSDSCTAKQADIFLCNTDFKGTCTADVTKIMVPGEPLEFSVRLPQRYPYGQGNAYFYTFGSMGPTFKATFLRH